MLEEALASDTPIESVYLDPEADAAMRALAARARDSGSRVYELESSVLTRVSGTVTPQPVMAVVADTTIPLGALASREPTLVVVCVEVRDPGNAGTVMRSAQAAGAGGVILCEGSVDVHNPKTVRASAGALFHLPVVAGGDPAEVLAELGSWGLRRLAGAARGGQPFTDADLRTPTALVVGNEAAGVPAALGTHIDGWVTIPMAGTSESLNVGVATAVLCFEAARQRARPDAGVPQLSGRGGSAGVPA